MDNRLQHLEDGGLLRIFPANTDDYVDVAPVANRLLFFWSDRRNPHEVQPAFKTRNGHSSRRVCLERKRTLQEWKGQHVPNNWGNGHWRSVISDRRRITGPVHPYQRPEWSWCHPCLARNLSQHHAEVAAETETTVMFQGLNLERKWRIKNDCSEARIMSNLPKGRPGTSITNIILSIFRFNFEFFSMFKMSWTIILNWCSQMFLWVLHQKSQPRVWGWIFEYSYSWDLRLFMSWITI